LSNANPAAHSSALAASLNNLAIRLSEAGRRDKAVIPAAEAVTLRRQLFRAVPAVHRAELAKSLSNLANSLVEVGQRAEAVAPAEEAVALYRPLAGANAAAYAPALARSLNKFVLRERFLARGPDLAIRAESTDIAAAAYPPRDRR
jgi:Tetratricopeptide repeat